jgi:DNA polymerase I-like protein with 3'-5' exonuclease and polymerase domains
MNRDSASDLFMLPQDAVSSDVRFYAKNGFVFANFYGASPKSCARNLWKVIPELSDKEGRPIFDYLSDNMIEDYASFEEHITEVADKFWKKFKVFRKWQFSTIEGYHENGYIENKFGFRRRGFIGRNEIINTNIQGSAFQCLLWSGIQINRKLRAEGFSSKVIGQIHDSLITSIHPEEFTDVTHIIKYTMETKLRETYPWIIVPMIAEFEASKPGGTWFELEGIEVSLPKKYKGY